MLTRPDGLADERVAAAVRAGWGVAVEGIEHAPVGFGSHHWVATGGGDRWFVTADDLVARRRYDAEPPGAVTTRLAAALSTARSLRDAGLRFVVAPVPTPSGAVLVPLGDRWAVALYPWVDGEAHDWGPYPSPAERLAVLDLLAALHAAPAAAYVAALVDDLAVTGRDALVVALADLARPWDAGPFGEPARALVADHAGELRGALAAHDDLAARVAARRNGMVLTHGEPHRGNTITTSDGVVLVDWDTALVAPPERDLWSLADEDPAVLGDYEARTGVAADPDALALYRSRWRLDDVAGFVRELRRHHADTADTRLAWRGLRGHVTGV